MEARGPKRAGPLCPEWYAQGPLLAMAAIILYFRGPFAAELCYRSGLTLRSFRTRKDIQGAGDCIPILIAITGVLEW